MQSELKNISQQMKALQKGEAWHGSSLEEALQGLDHQTAAKIPFEGAHSIWEYVLHLAAWRNFAKEKLNKKLEYQIDIGGEVDWPPIEEIDAASWEKAKNTLAQTGNELIELLLKQESKILEEKVSGKGYSFYVLLHGIVQHDAYHCGQIVLSRKLLKAIS